MVYIRCAGTTKKDITAGSELVIAVEGTIAEEYLPVANMIFYKLATAIGKRVRVSFNTDGKITYTATEDMAAGTGINMHVAFHTGKAAF